MARRIAPRPCYDRTGVRRDQPRSRWSPVVDRRLDLRGVERDRQAPPAEDLDAAIGVLEVEVDTLSSDATAHEADTTAHGATGANVGTTNTQNLSNKTLLSGCVINNGVTINEETIAGLDTTKMVRVLGQGGAQQSTTNSTAVLTVCDVTIPGGTMGANSSLLIYTRAKYLNASGGALVVRAKVYLGGVLYFHDADSIASLTDPREIWHEFLVSNANSVSTQHFSGLLKTSYGLLADGGGAWGDWNRTGSSLHLGSWGSAGAENMAIDKNLKIEIYQSTTAAGVTLTDCGYVVLLLP